MSCVHELVRWGRAEERANTNSIGSVRVCTALKEKPHERGIFHAAHDTRYSTFQRAGGAHRFAAAHSVRHVRSEGEGQTDGERAHACKCECKSPASDVKNRNSNWLSTPTALLVQRPRATATSRYRKAIAASSRARMLTVSLRVGQGWVGRRSRQQWWRVQWRRQLPGGG